MLRPYRNDYRPTKLIFGLGLVFGGMLVLFSRINLNLWFGGCLIFGGLLALIRYGHSWTGKHVHSAFVKERRYFRLLEREARIVVIGGGTGLGTILRGLKKITHNLTAIVTVADDGGSSGRLRKEFGILPPGDIRNCLIAMADLEPLMEQLMQYRFNGGSGLAGHNFGNLFLTAMTGITGDFQKAIEASVKVLAVKGRIFAATLDNVSLRAELQDGEIVKGESTIGQSKAPIKRVYLEPAAAKAVPESLQAIAEADLIILGPGSLFTSVIPPLLVNEILAAVKNSAATKIYICNVMTQRGETDGFTAADHLRALLEHTDGKLVDYMIINNQEVPPEARAAYAEEGAEPVLADREKVSGLGVRPIAAPLLNTNGLVRHDADLLAKLLMELMPAFLRRGKYWSRYWQRFLRLLGGGVIVSLGITEERGLRHRWPWPPLEREKELKFDFITKNLNRFQATACEVYTNQEEAPPELQPYKLDYQKNLVVGVYLGERPSGGFALTPVAVRLKNNRIVITYREEEPWQAGAVQRLTYPAAFFILDRTQLPTGQLSLHLRREEEKRPVWVEQIFL
ncbi:MAG TPA: uridine diphosphate-N-acetylglucosamine-binding protein YvcK [Firmicutes bacterium]|nr:uridine diphosphate-N-acetylglucosamine-binding protein YvcK [Bacillota bacterium]